MVTWRRAWQPTPVFLPKDKGAWQAIVLLRVQNTLNTLGSQRSDLTEQLCTPENGYQQVLEGHSGVSISSFDDGKTKKYTNNQKYDFKIHFIGNIEVKPCLSPTPLILRHKMVKQHDVIDSLTVVASGLGGSRYTSELEKGRRQEIGSNHFVYKLMTNCQINQTTFARMNVTYLWNAFYEMYLVVLRLP